MSILDHLIQSAESAEAFEAFFKKAAKRLLIIGIVFGILACVSIRFLYFEKDLIDRYMTSEALCGLALIPYLLAPPVICLSLSLFSFRAAKYVHPKRYEFTDAKKK